MTGRGQEGTFRSIHDRAENFTERVTLIYGKIRTFLGQKLKPFKRYMHCTEKTGVESRGEKLNVGFKNYM